MADMEKLEQDGLGKDEWPELDLEGVLEKAPIERLGPGTPLHARVLRYLCDRLNGSERKMSEFYPRWEAAERRVQAYVHLSDYERLLQEMNERGEPPRVVNIVVPYSYATISTIATYMLHTFCGQRPMFQIGSYKKETAKSRELMELWLQYNADRNRLVKWFWQFFWDCELYGFGVHRTLWREERQKRTVWTKPEGLRAALFGNKPTRMREERLTYAGNDVVSVDPYLFFPDTKVPMSEVGRRGEFCFWRSFEGKHHLLGEEAAGRLRWVRHAGDSLPNAGATGDSSRAARSLGDSIPGATRDAYTHGAGTMQVDQGTVWIIPAELGLGESTRPELWLFTILNKKQVVQAEPFDYDHGRHPVSVAEPNGIGYGFGQLGQADYLAPMQDTLSWLVNSHIQNVRTVLNNMLVVDPSAVEMQDLKKPGPGKLIRLKQSALGRDVRQVIQQLPVTDVTGNHLNDFQVFMRMGDALSSVNDNLRGLQTEGGRKTATEVRTSGEAGASRLAAKARVMSAQAFQDLTEQMVLNTLQFLDDDFYFSVVGVDGEEHALIANGADMSGDFWYPVHDGTLPLDRVAQMEIWKELFTFIAGDPELRQQFQVVDMFEHIAKLGGARNLDQFRMDMQVMPDQALQQQAQAGNMVPVPMGGMPHA